LRWEVEAEVELLGWSVWRLPREAEQRPISNWFLSKWSNSSLLISKLFSASLF